MSTIADTVKKIRKYKKWTQEKLAQELGVSYSTVNNWERGHRQPHPFMQRQITNLESSLDTSKAG